MRDLVKRFFDGLFGFRSKSPGKVFVAMLWYLLAIALFVNSVFIRPGANPAILPVSICFLLVPLLLSDYGFYKKNRVTDMGRYVVAGILIAFSLFSFDSYSYEKIAAEDEKRRQAEAEIEELYSAIIKENSYTLRYQSLDEFANMSGIVFYVKQDGTYVINWNRYPKNKEEGRWTAFMNEQGVPTMRLTEGKQKNASSQQSGGVLVTRREDQFGRDYLLLYEEEPDSNGNMHYAFAYPTGADIYDASMQEVEQEMRSQDVHIAWTELVYTTPTKIYSPWVSGVRSYISNNTDGKISNVRYCSRGFDSESQPVILDVGHGDAMIITKHSDSIASGETVSSGRRLSGSNVYREKQGKGVVSFASSIVAYYKLENGEYYFNPLLPYWCRAKY